jgi:hypothetical protein
MKTLTLIVSLIISSVALAEDPAELVKLRTIYDKSLRGEFQKVGKLYHKELLQLKKNYMQAENLEGAVAVDKEIKKLRETHGKMVVKIPEAEEKASPFDGVWIVKMVGSKSGRDTPRIFKGDKMLTEHGGWLKCTFEDDTVLVDWGLPKYWERLKFNPDNPDVLEAVNGGGSKFTYTRLKW